MPLLVAGGLVVLALLIGGLAIALSQGGDPEEVSSSAGTGDAAASQLTTTTTAPTTTTRQPTTTVDPRESEMRKWYLDYLDAWQPYNVALSGAQTQAQLGDLQGACAYNVTMQNVARNVALREPPYPEVAVRWEALRFEAESVATAFISFCNYYNSGQYGLMESQGVAIQGGVTRYNSALNDFNAVLAEYEPG